MRILALVFAALVVAIQYPLWFGKGGWLRVRDLTAQVDAARAENEKRRARNEALDAEVRNLKQGTEALEERARAELGMIKPDEVFFQLVEALPRAEGAAPAAEPGKPAGGPVRAPAPAAAPAPR